MSKTMNSIQESYKLKNVDFITAPYEKQKEIVMWWKVWGQPSNTPLHVERILLVLRGETPVVLAILGKDLREAAATFCKRFKAEEKGTPDYTKAKIDFYRANNSLIIDIDHDIYFAELTPQQYKRYVINNGKEGLDWKVKEGEVILIDTPYEQQWLQAILNDSACGIDKITL